MGAACLSNIVSAEGIDEGYLINGETGKRVAHHAF